MPFIRAGNNGPRKFHNYGECPYYFRIYEDTNAKQVSNTGSKCEKSQGTGTKNLW